MEWIIFLIVYLVSCIIVWIFIHLSYNKLNYDEDKVLWLCFNFIPIINSIVIIIAIIASFIILTGLVVGKIWNKLNITFDKFYKLK